MAAGLGGTAWLEWHGLAGLAPALERKDPGAGVGCRDRNRERRPGAMARTDIQGDRRGVEPGRGKGSGVGWCRRRRGGARD